MENWRSRGYLPYFICLKLEPKLRMPVSPLYSNSWNQSIHRSRWVSIPTCDNWYLFDPEFMVYNWWTSFNCSNIYSCYKINKLKYNNCKVVCNCELLYYVVDILFSLKPNYILWWIFPFFFFLNSFFFWWRGEVAINIFLFAWFL
jgi:hypothetical protein